MKLLNRLPGRGRSRSSVALLVWFLLPQDVRAQGPAPTAEEVLQRFEERLQALEGENRALREQVRALAAPRDAESSSPGPGFPSTTSEPSIASSNPSIAGDPEAAIDTGAPTSRLGPTAATFNSRGRTSRLPLKAWLGQGFELASEDDEFQLQFHNETQIDYRGFTHTGQGTVHNGFFIPRQIWTLNGRFTRRLEYLTSFQRGLGGFELRDAVLNFKVLPEDQLMIRVGRYRVPYTYEFFAMSNQDLISPERSVFALNFSNVRELGVMAWGTVGDDRLDYAAGVFNGVQNGFEETNDTPNFAGFINVRPFRHSSRFEFLNYLNLGASTEVGDQSTLRAPPALRTSVTASQASGSSVASPAFLAFNNSTREEGMRALGSIHAAWFYRSLSLMAEWDWGVKNYVVDPDPSRISVPIQAYYVQAGYFLTGEQLTRRGPFEIRRPFNPRPGKDFGLGAFEIGARYATLRIDDNVFAAGLADANLWSNNVQVTDIGINWYLNRYLKVYLDWQRSEFGVPVAFGDGRYYKNSDLFWARLQFLY